MTYGREAKWERIARWVTEQIERGELRPGDPVPGERELAARFMTARGTVRDGLRALEDTGVLVPGRPRTVAQYRPVIVHVTRTADRLSPGESPTLGADSWLADTAGLDPTQLVETWTEVAPSAVAQRLEIVAGEVVQVRRNIRQVGDTPHGVVKFWFPADVAEGTPLEGKASIREGSVAWLEKEHGKLSHSIRVRSRMPIPEESRLLDIPAGPVTVVWRTSRTGDRPLVTSMATYPADRIELELDL